MSNQGKSVQVRGRQKKCGPKSAGAADYVCQGLYLISRLIFGETETSGLLGLALIVKKLITLTVKEKRNCASPAIYLTSYLTVPDMKKPKTSFVYIPLVQNIEIIQMGLICLDFCHRQDESKRRES